jgi:hypothetical protein
MTSSFIFYLRVDWGVLWLASYAWGKKEIIENKRSTKTNLGTRRNRPLQNRGGYRSDSPRKRQEGPNTGALGWSCRRADSGDSPACWASWEKPRGCYLKEWQAGSNLTPSSSGVTRRYGNAGRLRQDRFAEGIARKMRNTT